MTKALGVMNPGSTSKAKLSRYHFAGMGPWMLGKVAENYKTPHPTELLEIAQDMGVRLIPCQMTMDLMGISKPTTSSTGSRNRSGPPPRCSR